MMPSTDMTLLQPGFVLDHYTLQRFLRADAKRSVWLAREAFTERVVNVHLCTEQGEYHVARFERAMSILGRLDHPAIARFVGSGYHAGSPYLVTEHVNGPTLEELVAQGGRMLELQVLRLAGQVADGFEQAWSRAEVIHRDLKPGSILVDVMAMRNANGAVEVKVTDFGQALGKRLVDQFEHDLAMEESDFQRATRAERVGSPICMSPEQILGRPLSQASDIYALGVTLYLLLAGRPPFTGDDAELQRQHAQVLPPELPADITPGTRALVKRMLGKHPDRRFDSWTQLREQIRGLVKRQEPRPDRRAATDVSSSTTEIRYRRTERFENTPAGQAIAEPSLPPPPAAEPGQAGVNSLLRMLDRLVQSQPPGSWPASPIGQPPPVATGPIQNAPVPPPATAGGKPPQHVISLSDEQLNTLWSHLFTRAEAPAAVTTPAGGTPALTRIQTPALIRIQSPAPVSLPDPVVAAPPTGPATAKPPVAEATERIPDAGAQSRQGRNATTSPTVADKVESQPAAAPWSVNDAVFAALAITVLHTAGNTRTLGGESVTSRITHRFKRMLGDRESILISVDQALRGQHLDEASRLLDGLAERGGNDGPICLRRARLAGLRGDYAGMIDWAQSAIVQKVDDPIALAMVAYGNLHLGQQRIAGVISRNLAEANGDSPLGPLLMAAVAMIAASSEEGAKHLAEARQIDAEHPTLILLTAAWWRVAGDIPAEIRTLVYYRECHGDTPEIALRFSELGCA